MVHRSPGPSRATDIGIDEWRNDLMANGQRTPASRHSSRENPRTTPEQPMTVSPADRVHPEMRASGRPSWLSRGPLIMVLLAVISAGLFHGSLPSSSSVPGGAVLVIVRASAGVRA